MTHIDRMAKTDAVITKELVQQVIPVGPTSYLAKFVNDEDGLVSFVSPVSDAQLQWRVEFYDSDAIQRISLEFVDDVGKAIVRAANLVGIRLHGGVR
jgi:hypothetical protein